MPYINIEKINEAKKEIVERMQKHITEWKEYSQSSVDYYEGHLRRPQLSEKLSNFRVNDSKYMSLI